MKYVFTQAHQSAFWFLLCSVSICTIVDSSRFDLTISVPLTLLSMQNPDSIDKSLLTLNGEDNYIRVDCNVTPYFNPGGNYVVLDLSATNIGFDDVFILSYPDKILANWKARSDQEAEVRFYMVSPPNDIEDFMVPTFTLLKPGESYHKTMRCNLIDYLVKKRLTMYFQVSYLDKKEASRFAKLLDESKIEDLEKLFIEVERVLTTKSASLSIP